MSEFMVTRHRVAIAGRAVDAVNGKPLRAWVEIIAGPPAYEARAAEIANGTTAGGMGAARTSARSRPDGLFFFLDLPEGDYQVVAFVPRWDAFPRPPLSAADQEKSSYSWRGDKRYGKQEFAATVSYGDDPFDRVGLIKLQPTGVTGRVVTSANQVAVLMAEVRVKGSGERTFSDAQGNYTLAGLEPNARKQRTIRVRAQGFRDQWMDVMIDEPGACKQLDAVKLVREKSR